MKSFATGFAEHDILIYTDAPFPEILKLNQPAQTVIITDENVWNLHAERLAGYRVIRVPAGEAGKTQASVDFVIRELLRLGISKDDLLLGVGGGVVTDLAGYAASIFKRGMRLGLVPTTLLAMTDAALGGKNGINVGEFKNMVGTIYRPEFVLCDPAFLTTLPAREWANGFAEIIKHACIKDAEMFRELENKSPEDFKADAEKLSALIERNIRIKNRVVVADERESGDRYVLNFGHSFGHALEKLHDLPHGYAVSIGMVIAARLSEKLAGFSSADTERLIKLSERYGLPVHISTDIDAVFNLMRQDKKAGGEQINFVLLSNIGEAIVKRLAFADLKQQVTGIL